MLLETQGLAPARDAIAVVPDDDVVIPATRGVYVGVSGNIAVRMASGTEITFVGAPVGILWIQVDKIFDTDTTATDMWALYGGYTKASYNGSLGALTAGSAVVAGVAERTTP